MSDVEYKKFTEQWLSPDAFITAHTSGSTGKPKEIHLLKADMVQSARATNSFFGIDSDSILATPLSLQYIAGKMMLVRALIAGCQFIRLPISNNVTIDSAVDLLAIVPSQIESLLAQDNAPYLIRNLLIGGAAPTHAQCKALTAKGIKAWISYGMTETCSHVALASAEDPDRLFRAMPGVRFTCDERSCLVINAPQYSFKTLVTNDVVDLVSDEYFIWRGRADNVINSGGVKLFPEELEKEYSGILGEIPYYVVGAPHSKWGEAAVLVIERNASISEDEILALLRSNISDHKHLPQKIILTDSLPRTANGKIRRILPPC